MKFKEGVILNNEKVKASHDIMKAMYIVDSLSKNLFRKEIVVTSVLDGKHKSGSKHYVGEAFDIRVWIYTAEQLKDLLPSIQRSLGKNYDVINENDHIHIEYDPK